MNDQPPANSLDFTTLNQDPLSLLGIINEQQGQQRGTVDSEGVFHLPSRAVPAGTEPPAHSEPPLQAYDIRPLFMKYLPDLDLNRDRKIGKDELYRAIVNPRVKGEEAQLVANLYENFGDFELSNFDINFGIDQKDIDKFDNKIRTLEDKRAAVEAQDLVDNWRLIDKDNNDFVSRDELQAAIKDTRINAGVREAYKDVLSHFDEIKKDHVDDGSDRGISNGDVQLMATSLKVDVNFEDYKRSLENGNRNLYGKFENPLDAIKPEAIRLNNSGGLLFYSSLASIAASDPAAIRNMIKVTANGDYSVSFPGVDHDITVTPPTDAEMLLYQNGLQYGTWALVLEKAWGKYKLGYNVDHLPPSEGSADGNRMDSIGALTGMNAQKWDASDNRVERALEELKESKTPLAAGIFDRDWNPLVGLGWAAPSDQRDLMKGWAYAVVDYDKENKVVTLYNPVGDRIAWNQRTEPEGADGRDKDGVHDGFFRMPLDEFQKTFDKVWTATP